VKDATITIRLQEEQKEKWMKHANETDKYDGLTHLINDAVEDRITEDNDKYSVGDQIDDVLHILEQQTQNQKKILELGEAIEDTQSTEVQIEEEIESLRTALETRITRLDSYDDS